MLHRLPQVSKVKSASALLFSQSLTASHTLKTPASVAMPSTSAVWSFSWLNLRPGGSWPDTMITWCGKQPACVPIS